MDKEPIPYPLLYGADVRRILASRDAEKPVAQKSAIGSILASTACAEWDRDKPTGVVYSDEALSSNDGRCQESLYQTRSQLSIGDTADNRDVVIGGLQEDLRLKNVPEIAGRVVPVDMNEALMTIVSPDNYRGGCGTQSLAGCTGIAGYATLPDGRVATYVSHVDPMADSMNRLDGKSATDGTCASELGIANFVGETLRLGATDIRIVAAYDATTVYHPDYGQRGERDFNNWHFLDQIQNALTWAEKRGSVQYVELPYRGDGHTLVSCLESGGPVVKFDGKPIDFPKNSDSSAP